MTHLPKKFTDLPLSSEVLNAIAEAGYVVPTDVQAGTIPLVMAGIDLIVQSHTGSGKTAAFGIPIAETIDVNPGTVQALVLTPTRELALQVSGEFRRVGLDAKGLKVVTVYGGASIRDQIEGLKTAEVIVATPGRMLDLLRRKATELSNLRVFVLDEADEMLSMGFERELEAIREFLPEDRQSVMFSATVTEDIKSVAAHTLYYPEYLSFSSDSVGAEEIDHFYCLISGVGRLGDLNRLIKLQEPEAAIIFCNTKDDSFRVANFLKRQGYGADVLNGDLPQSEREKVMGRMKSGKLQFLVATDIAARGIDISFLPCVINYVLPESAESYIHRTGRTGRAGRHGTALSLVSPREIGMFYQLRRAYKVDLVNKDLPSEEELNRLKERRAMDEILDGLDANEDLDYGRMLTFADSLAKLPDYRTRVAKLLAYFVAERDRRKQQEPAVQQPATQAQPTPEVSVAESAPSEAPAEEQKDREPRGERRSRREKKPQKDREQKADGNANRERSEAGERRSKPERAKPARANRDDEPDAGSKQRAPKEDKPRSGRNGATAGMARLRFNVGTTRFEKAQALIELVAEWSGLEVSDLGKAKLFKEHSWVEVREDMAEDVIAALDRETIDDHVLAVSR